MTKDSSPEQEDTRSDMQLVSVRWWQVLGFIRMNLEVVRGSDPWADRVLARPWSLSSLREYVYMLATFPVSTAQYIVVAGRRVGVVWTMERSNLMYILNLGLMPAFRKDGAGSYATRILDAYMVERFEAAMAAVAVSNQAIQHIIETTGGQPLGLKTTRLELTHVRPPAAVPAGLHVERVRKSEAVSAWKAWKVRAAEQVAGPQGARVARSFLEALSWFDPFPQGDYLTLRRDDRDLGFAWINRYKQKPNLGLLVSASSWSGPETAEMVAAITSYLGFPIRYLTVVRKHADRLEESAPLEFRRNRERERYFAVWLAEGRSVSHELGDLFRARRDKG